MITEVEDYFIKGCGRCARFDTPECSTRKWSEGLKQLRRICREAGLVETVKWAHPCYMHSGRNIAIVGAFRADFRLSFMNPALMKDPHNVLERQGPNTRHRNMIRFTRSAQVEEVESTILDYLREAMGYAEAGMRPPKEHKDLDLPVELAEAMDTDPELGEAFHNLTPGRQRSYVVILNSAKTAATRISRIAKFRDQILAGKGATER
jgi:uncharacterized protein YdeI (YjbR/CyaY-like superfamily)